MALPRSQTCVLSSYDLMPPNGYGLGRLKEMISGTHCNTITLLIKDDVVLDTTTLNSIINLLKNDRKITRVQLKNGNKADLFKLAAAFTASFFPQEEDVNELNNLLPAKKFDGYFAAVVANVRAYLNQQRFNDTLTAISLYQADNKARACRVVLPLATLQRILDANEVSIEQLFLACHDYIKQAYYLYHAHRYNFFPVITVNPIDGVVLNDNLDAPTSYPIGVNTQAKRREFYLTQLSKLRNELDRITVDHEIGINDHMLAGHALLTAQNLIQAGCPTIASVESILAHLTQAQERLEKTPQEEMDKNDLAWLIQCSLSSLQILSSIGKQTKTKARNISISPDQLRDLLARAETFMECCKALLAPYKPKAAEIYLKTLARYATDIAETFYLLENSSALKKRDEFEKWLRICFSLYSQTTLNDSSGRLFSDYLHTMYKLGVADKYRELFRAALALVIQKRPEQPFMLINHILTYMANESILHQSLYDLVVQYITQNDTTPAMREPSKLTLLFSEFITDTRDLLNRAMASENLEMKKMIHDLIRFLIDMRNKLPKSIFSLYLKAHPGGLQLLINHLDDLMKPVMKPAAVPPLQDQANNKIIDWFAQAWQTLDKQEQRLHELLTQLEQADSKLGRVEEKNSSPNEAKRKTTLKQIVLFPPADDSKKPVEPLSPVNLNGNSNTR